MIEIGRKLSFHSRNYPPTQEKGGLSLVSYKGFDPRRIVMHLTRRPAEDGIDKVWYTSCSNRSNEGGLGHYNHGYLCAESWEGFGRGSKDDEVGIGHFDTGCNAGMTCFASAVDAGGKHYQFHNGSRREVWLRHFRPRYRCEWNATIHR